MATGDHDVSMLAALWREKFPSQRFEAIPFDTTLKPPPADLRLERVGPGSREFISAEKDYVTFAVISDTHGKHGKFAGYEVPARVNSAHEYLSAAGKLNLVAAQIEKAASSATDSFLRAPLFTSEGQIYSQKSMSIMPVVLLSGNRKSIIPPSGWQPAASREAQETASNEAQPRDSKEFNKPNHDGVVIPYADVLIHCGDFTMKGSEGEVESFCQFMSQLPHRHKLLVAGNHDVSLDAHYFAREDVKKRWKLTSGSLDLPSRLRKRLAQASVTYLEDQAVTIGPFPCETAWASGEAKDQISVRCFGSPVQPAYHDWAFQKQWGAEIAQHWEQVLPPDGSVDVLITHGPPLGRGDRPCLPMQSADSEPGSVESAGGVAIGSLSGGPGWDDLASARAGCPSLLEKVQAHVRPLLHVFGHVHADHASDSWDGVTTFVNAALTDNHNNLRASARVKTVCVPVTAFGVKSRRAGVDQATAS